MFGVETDSFLPNNQSNGRDLAGQGETFHGWFHPSGNSSLVEILERSGGRSCSCRGALEDILQIVIMIFVQYADGQHLLGAFQLTTPATIFPAGVSLQRQADVGPQLPLGTETV